MPQPKSHLKLSKSGTQFIINTRLEIIKRDLFLFLGSVFLFLVIAFLGFGAGLLAAIGLSMVLSVLFTFFYTLFRFSAWLYYQEIVIDGAKTELKIINKFLNKERNSRVVTNRFDKSNFCFRELNQSGKRKFLMQYKDYKNYDLLILKDETELNMIQEFIISLNP